MLCYSVQRDMAALLALVAVREAWELARSDIAL
jgi:hypothetical protein